tara:strand:- start:298 stop:870 length:573 start_codon:yes stop_codon:yes gene_type:complete
MKKIALIIFLILPFLGNGQQEKLPFHEIGNYPEEYSEINLVSRMIEGLGYRYYWATESLNEKDLMYKPSNDSRTTFEIIEHIYTLSLMIASSFKNEKINFNSEKFSYTELRERTLNNFSFVFESLKKTSDLSALKIQFDRPRDNTFPFWNQINGPISDAIWHSGQVVMNRRASGNPLRKGVNVFLGKTTY